MIASPSGQSRTRAVAVNTISQFGSNVLNTVLATLVSIAVVRHVGRAEYGVMVFVVSYLSYFLPLSSLGVDTLLMREIARRPNEASDAVGVAFYLRGALSIATMILAWVLVPFVTSEPRVLRLVILYSTTLLFSIQGLYQVALFAQLRSPIVNATSALLGLVFTSLRLGLVLAGATIGYFLATEVLAAALGLVLSRWVARRYSALRPKIRVDWQAWKSLLGQSWPIALATWLIALHNRIDQGLLFRLRGAEALGGYSVAVRISEVWVLFANVFMFSVFPLLSRDSVAGPNNVERTSRITYRYLYGGILPVTLALAFNAESVIRVVFGGAFVDAATPLRFLAVAEIFVFSNAVTYNVLLSSGRQRQAALLAGLALVFNGLLNLLWVPRWGASGAAFASVLSYASVPLFGIAVPATRSLAFRAFATLGRPAAAAGATALGMWTLDVSPLSGLLFLCVAYPVALVATGSFGREDVALVRRAIGLTP